MGQLMGLSYGRTRGYSQDESTEGFLCGEKGLRRAAWDFVTLPKSSSGAEAHSRSLSFNVGAKAPTPGAPTWIELEGAKLFV